MKKIEFSSQELSILLEKVHNCFEDLNYNITKDDLMSDKDVMELFDCCPKTLEKLKANGEIKYFKLGSRCYYLKMMIYLQILEKYND